MRSALAVLLGGSLAVGCIGQIGGTPGGSDSDNDSTDQAFTCTPGDPSATILPRLSREQYLASLRDVVAVTLGPSDVEGVMAGVDAALTLVPADGDPDHAKLDQDVSQAHVDGQYYVAVAFAEQLTATPEHVERLVGACAVDTDTANDETCLDAFIRDVGRRIHRRPLTDDLVAFYRDEVFEPADGMEVAAIRDVLVVMALSPWFLYHIENEGAAVDGRNDLFELSPYELAARLSFHFWNAPPDDALLAAAESGALATDDGYAAEIERLVRDPRTRATMDRFFAEWFELDDLAPLDTSVGDPAFDAFAGSDVPTSELRGRILEDSLDLVRHVSWDAGGSLADVFLTDLSFAKTEDVASIYGGVPLWTEGATPEPLPAGQRAGILTRPAMLATGSNTTHLVLRGREVRKNILCDTIPAPPADAMNNIPDLNPNMTERERMEELTGTGSCAGCHAMMNPIGFTLGAYDGLGRFRTEETMFGDDGSVLATLPLDTQAAPALVATDTAVARDGIELSEMVATSDKTHGCFARHYFRFTFARAEDDEIDGCTLEQMFDSLREGAPLAEVLRDIALSPTFRLRKLAP
jgi:hypothetical protein